MKNLSTGEHCAVKLFVDELNDITGAKQLLREIKISRELSLMKRNIFTPKILDIIIPGCSLSDEDQEESFLNPMITSVKSYFNLKPDQ